MTLDEVLSLPKEKKSIKKIESFLSKEVSTSLSYHKALAYKAYILYLTDNKSEAFTILIDNVSKTQGEAKIGYLDVLIDIYLNQEDFAKALKYIDIKKDILSPIDSFKHTLDLIKYSVKRSDLEKAKKYILEIIDDDIDIPTRLYVTKILLDYAFNEGNLDVFNKYFTYLEDYYISNNNLDLLEEISVKKLKLYFDKCLYTETLDLIDKTNLEVFNEKTKIIFYTIHIKTLLKTNNFRKASILDASYEPFVKANIENNKEECFEYYSTTLELYTDLDNKYSINYINDILSQINIEGTTKQDKKSKPKSKFKEFNESLAQNQEIREEVRENDNDLKEFKYASSDKDKLLVSSIYKKLNEVINTINQIDPYLEFREILRLTLIEFSKTFEFSEAFVYIDKDTSYQYKNKRVYDKNNLENYYKTINYRTFELGKEIVIHNLTNTFYNESILTHEVSEYLSAIAFPISYNLKVVGSIAFFFDNDIIDDNFEYYKIISNIIEIIYSYKYYAKQEALSKNLVNILEDKIDIGFKSITLDNIVLSAKAKEIYNVDTSELELNDFYNLIKERDRHIFKGAINLLLEEEASKDYIKYHLYDDRLIEDRLYLSDNNTIYSYIRDITLESRENNKLIKSADNSNFIDVYSYSRLRRDYTEIFKDKDKSLVLIDASNFDTYTKLYGFEFASDIIIALSRLLIDYKNDFDYSLYHLESIKFILVLNYNDKRKILKNVKQLLKTLSTGITKINKRVNLRLFAGVFKASKNTKNVALKDALDFATEALVDAESEDERVVIYSSELYEKKYFNDFYYEIELSEALDNNKLESIYTPIYDIENSMILGYSYNLSLDSVIIDEGCFKDVVRKRNMEYQVDKYMLEHIVLDLKAFYQKCGYFLNIFIKINGKSLKEETFIPFLSNLFNFYKVSSSLISFQIEGEMIDNKVLDVLKKSGVNLGTNSLDNLFKFDLDTIYLDNNIYSIEKIENIKKSTDKRIIILNLNNLKELEKIKSITSYVDCGKESRKYSLSNLINKSAT